MSSLTTWPGPHDDARLGFWITDPSLAAVAPLADAGLDFAVIDCQHSAVDEAAAAEVLTSAHPTIPVFARSSSLDRAAIGRLLDAGAASVVVPQVDDETMCRAAVSAAMYPPRGQRSFGPRHPRLGRDPVSVEAAGGVIPLIESRAGVSAARAVCGVEGLTGVMIGPADLALSLGLPVAGAASHPEVLDCVTTVVAAARRAGLGVGAHANTPDEAVRLIEHGVRAVTVGSISSLAALGARAFTATVTDVEPRTERRSQP